MARRKFDQVPGIRRGQEPLDNPIWEERVNILLNFLKKKPCSVIDISKALGNKYKWGESYVKNVLAAADIKEVVTYDVESNKWSVSNE